jgi:uncharacterized membrane protein
MLRAFTAFHVVLSLIAIVSGFAVTFGLLANKLRDGWTKVFLAAVALTLVTGFLFPFVRFTPADALGIVGLVCLAFAVIARYRFLPAGRWRRTWVISAALSLYLNVFVLIVQLFQKVPALKALAPTQSEPPFQIVQLVALVAFITLTVSAVRNFHGEPLRASSSSAD